MSVIHRCLTLLLASGLVLLGLPEVPAAATGNTPCSGRKGGIDHCQGETFICRDGSVSASRKSCSATQGASGLLGASPAMTPTGAKTCDCRSGSYCTGPRGGRFCFSDSGHKSYLRK